MADFRDHLLRVVEGFLETAVVVDDEALFHEMARAQAQAGDEEPMPVHSRKDLALDVPADADLAVAEEQHPLDTKGLIDAFADMGVVCSVLAPLDGDQIRERVLKAAARADLLVFDWVINRDDGETARQLIRSVLDQDKHGDRRRLRVIAIYTGQVGLKTIMEKVRKDLGLPPAATSADGVTLVRENVRIVAIGKPVQGRTRPEYQSMQVAETDLPARLAIEFAHLTDGLVPAVALASLAAVRNDTHRVLQALRATMDIGYLGHRVASSFPQDAESHLVEMVSAEIASVLSDDQVGDNANLSVIRMWLLQDGQATDSLSYGAALSTPKTISPAQLDTMLADGLGLDDELEKQKADGLGLKALKALRKEAAHLFTDDVAVAEASANLFGMRMAVKTLYGRPIRVLRLGSIVLRDEEFMICLQPRCDSIRLTPGEPRGFPFLPLIASDGDKRHEFVVEHPDDSRLVRLQLQVKPFGLRTIPFECDETRSVRARSVGGKLSFYSTRNRPHRWVADLKPEFAQRVAVELAAQMARVGLAESELVRLSAD